MKFLVAVDGSDESTAALGHALDVAAARGASLTAVHAVEPEVRVEERPPTTSFAEVADRLTTDFEAAEERGERILDDARAAAGDHGDVAFDAVLLYGDPVEVVPEFAAAEGYDGLFVGHRGMSARAESLLGSVADGLVAHSSVPVTVVR